ncbi:MAG: hypothetical protein FD171_424 [Actinobacteria bacterium]|nr:MAG: hypothetical protein FD171_424 [Actinomycetota bacterium]
MEARDHKDPLNIESVVQAVGESLDQKAARLAVIHRIGGREVKHRFNRIIHRLEELIAKTRALNLIPFPCALDIDESIGKNP